MSNRDFKSSISNNDENGKEKDWKKIVIIVLSLLVLIIIISSIIFSIKNKDNGDTQANGGSESTSSSIDPSLTPSGRVTISENPQEDQSSQNSPTTTTRDGRIPDGYGMNFDENGNRILTEDPNAPDYDEGYFPTKEPNIDNPVETGVRNIDEEGEYDIFDNSSASMETIAKLVSIGMLSPSISEGGYRESVTGVLNSYGTEKAKKAGFRPWYVGEEHTAAWKSAMNRGGGYISAAFNQNNKRITWYSNDTIRVDAYLSQFSHINGIRTPLGKQSITIYMKKEGEAWKVDAYDFPSKPSFY